MITCPEYAQVSSEHPPGSSWDEHTSFLDRDAVAPGSIEGEVAYEEERDDGNENVWAKIICENWVNDEFKTRIPGSVDRNAKITLGIRDAIELEFKGQVCMALDIVYARVSELIRLGWIVKLNDEIESIDPNEIGTDVLLGILTSTLPVRSQLPYRSKLYREAFKILKQRRHFERGILDGLE